MVGTICHDFGHKVTHSVTPPKISVFGIPFVGDKESDLAAARVVNALPVLVRGATPDDEARSRHESSLTYDDLASFVGDLLAGVHTRRMAELAQESSSAADRAN